MKSFFRIVFSWSVLGAVLSCLALTACSKGPFSPEAKYQAAERNRYLKTLQSALTTDDTFEWNTLSSALIVRALLYTPKVAGEAERRFRNDPAFNGETAGWHYLPRGAAGPPVIVLMGIFTPDLKGNDIIRNGRFRPRLAASDGRVLAPVEIKRFGRDSVFIRDHFPVFNPWEEVYLLRFASPGHNWPSGPVEFRLEWPGGVQTMLLNGR